MYIFVGTRQEIKLMKYLYIIRHANSGWAEAGMRDIERTLDQKGLIDAPIMAQQLFERMEGNLDLIYSSPATRALTTAKVFHNKFSLDEVLDIRTDIYQGGVDEILDIIIETENKHNSIAIFGHNPTFTYLLNHLASANIDNLPPCGIAVLKIDIDDWKLISPDLITLEEVLSPQTQLN